MAFEELCLHQIDEISDSQGFLSACGTWKLTKRSLIAKIINILKTKHSIFYADGFNDKNDRDKEKLASKKQQTQER